MKKGVALIWAVVLCAVLMLIATIITTAVIKESQFSVRVDSSVRAFSAASSGIEWGKYCIQDNLEKNAGSPEPAAACYGPNSFTIASNPNNEEYTVTILKGSELPSPSYKITSVGKVGIDVKRVLEYKYTAVDMASVENNELTSPNAINFKNSFTLSYDFWLDKINPASRVEFGVENSNNPKQKIGIVYSGVDNGKMSLLVTKDASTQYSSKAIDLSSLDLASYKDEPYWLNVQLKYVYQNSAVLTLRRRYRNSTVPELQNKLDYCSARTSIDLSSTNRRLESPFTNFYFGDNITSTQDTTPLAGGGDGNVAKLFKIATPSIPIGFIDTITTSQ